MREARALADRGVRELLLISQDTTFYGIDRGERGALARLLRELNAIDGLEWIRLLYLYPTTITDDVLDAMAECEKVCRYVDLPLQHASAGGAQAHAPPRQPADLRRAARPHPRSACRASPSARPSSSGSLGRPTQDFAELEGFVADTGFDHLGVFTYSHEEGTRAFGLADDVPAGGEAPAAQRADGAAEEDRGQGAESPDRQRRGGPGRGPLAGARAGPAGPPGGAGPRYRLGGVPDRLRPRGSTPRGSSSGPGSSARGATTSIAAPVAGLSRVRGSLGQARFDCALFWTARVLYLWVAASSKVTRVGLCPLFVFQARFCLTSAPAACAGGGWGSASGEH